MTIGTTPTSRLFFGCAIALYGLLTSGCSNAPPAYVVLETTLGDVVVELDVERAPAAASYWLGYVERGQYDGATLYRSASLDDGQTPQLVQGGLLLDAITSTDPIDVSNYQITYLETFETTADSGLAHRAGSISLARDLIQSGHVIPEIVFCLRDVPAMNQGARDVPDNRGFPAIGRVVSGLAVIELTSRQPLGGATNIAFLDGQILTEPVVIRRAYKTLKPLEYSANR